MSSSNTHIPLKRRKASHGQYLRRYHGLTQKITFRDKKKSASQKQWIARQKNDPFVQLAEKEGWRCRSAFKLLELNNHYHLINHHTCAVDLGAAPGGWSQVLIKKKARQVFGVDLLPIAPMAGAQFIQGDFREKDIQEQLLSLCHGHAPDLVISDMAPNTTGHQRTDHLRIITLAQEALDFACHTLAPGGNFVAKLFQGGHEKELFDQVRKNFSSFHLVKPQACRKESSEIYIVALHFLPSQTEKH